MDGFSNLDPIIATWVEHLGSKLFTEWAGAPARFFYTPGDPPFEVFQISVDVPHDGRTAVHARAVDTNDETDDQMDLTWEGPSVDLDTMLSLAVETINGWKARRRIKPDPPSPW
jgi:hypothetical protein